MNDMSYAQRERQRTRSKGRYSRMNPCESCGKSTGASFCSDPRSNGGPGWVLCTKCHSKGTAMDYADAVVWYRRRQNPDAGIPY